MKWADSCSDKESYFVLINKRGSTIRQGEEVFYFYDDLPNRWLLFNYSFAFKDNAHDNIELDLVKDPASSKAEDLVNFKQAESFESFPLQKDRLNLKLLTYLRAVRKYDVTPEPSNLEQEKHVLSTYRDVVDLLRQKTESQTTLE